MFILIQNIGPNFRIHPTFLPLGFNPGANFAANLGGPRNIGFYYGSALRNFGVGPFGFNSPFSNGFNLPFYNHFSPRFNTPFYTGGSLPLHYGPGFPVFTAGSRTPTGYNVIERPFSQPWSFGPSPLAAAYNPLINNVNPFFGGGFNPFFGGGNQFFAGGNQFFGGFNPALLPSLTAFQEANNFFSMANALRAQTLGPQFAANQISNPLQNHGGFNPALPLGFA